MLPDDYSDDSVTSEFLISLEIFVYPL